MDESRGVRGVGVNSLVGADERSAAFNPRASADAGIDNHTCNPLRVVDYLPTPILVSNSEGVFVSGNPRFCSVANYSTEDLRDRTVDDLFRPVGPMIEWRLVAAESSDGAHALAILVDGDGSPLHVRLAVAAVRIPSELRLLWTVEDRSAVYWEIPSAWGA